MIERQTTIHAWMGAPLWALFFLAFVSTALAGPPTHLHRPALDLSGGPSDPGPTHPAQPFDHACGVAVDSKGDIYVASAGNDAIEIFNPAHEHLTTIANNGEPCGLAVDSKGNLYASESTTGKVVKYHPTEYPFSGVPAYEAAVTVDASGEAAGIFVDPADDRLYVAADDRIVTYDSTGKSGIDEEQRLLPFNATGGTYRLSFEGQTTAPLPYQANHAEVQAALEGLSTIGVGNVVIGEGKPTFEGRDHIVTFAGALTQKGVPQIACDASGLEGASPQCSATTIVDGFAGHIAANPLANYTGVAAYTYASGGLFLFAADASGDQIKVLSGSDFKQLRLRKTIDGPRPGEDFGFGTSGAYLAVDKGNGNAGKKCSSIGEQACTAGHLIVYDNAHDAVDEFDASGEFLDRIEDPALTDAEPTGMAIERSGGPNDGTVYVTAGPGAGAKLLAFGPLAAPSRSSLPQLSQVLKTARAVETDSAGDVYVAAGSTIHVFAPDGKEIKVGPGGKGIETEDDAADLAVDSTGGLYALENVSSENDDLERVRYYTPNSYPPHDGTGYGPPTVVATGGDFVEPATILQGIEINPANDRLFVLAYAGGQILELGSAAEGSPILNPCFGCGLGTTSPLGIAAYEGNGNVYVSEQFGRVLVIDPSGTEIITRITAAGSPKGVLPANPNELAVDQSNGHVLFFNNSRGAVEEYDAGGGFVAQFAFPEPQSFSTEIARPSGIAVDNSGGPTDGNAYVAFDDTKAATPDLWAFGPLAYGEPPNALTGIADGLGAGSATLHGTVDPRGFDLTECKLEYLPDAQYASNGKTFAGAIAAPCAESLAGIGKGSGPVPVHAIVEGLSPEGRYRFRLVAANKYGPSEGKVGLFGPPLLTPRSALPVLYDEAALRADVNPFGLTTTYRFEYGTSAGEYDHSTPEVELPPGDGAIAVQAALTGLEEATTYYFRILAENEAGSVPGPEQIFTTLMRTASPSCPNEEYRTGLSADLPACRAYELATPAEGRGSLPYAAPPSSPGKEFNNWLVTPRGDRAGESLAFSITGTVLPGFAGTGATDAYRARRTTGEGAHPPKGWTTEIISPSHAEVGGGGARAQSVASDHDYWPFSISNFGALEGGFPTGEYLRTPSGFEAIGQGSLGADLGAESRFISTGGAHVIFFSDKHLEPTAAPEGTVAIYDRVAGNASAEVVSLKPDDTPFGAGENAAYVGSNEDGSAVVFKVGSQLYVRQEKKTVQVNEGPSSFAGIAEDGKRVFYADAAISGNNTPPAGLYACDVVIGPCAGSEKAQEPVQIAEDSIFVNVSPDGSRVLFISDEVLTGSEKNEADENAEAGEHNLYTWDGSSTRFVAVLAAEDLEKFGGSGLVNLRSWTAGVSAGQLIGRDSSPTRSTPDGKAFVFQSHARLTAYDNKGIGEIYRYEPTAPIGQELLCVSCDPTNAPASADAMLQTTLTAGGVTSASTLIANITDDGQRVFFESPEQLLPRDANHITDVYEWTAQGAGDCKRLGGCLALISSGQGEDNNYLYGMSADGSDVFFETSEKLVAADLPGSPSIYDARVEGGLPDPLEEPICQGDACQGAGSPPPTLIEPGTTSVPGGGNVAAARKPSCPKGKRKVKRDGKARCVKPHKVSRHGRTHRKTQAKRKGNR